MSAREGTRVQGPSGSKGKVRAHIVTARVPSPVSSSDHHPGGLAGGPDGGKPLPAQPERRHHQQRGHHRQVALHLVDRSRDDRHHGPRGDLRGGGGLFRVAYWHGSGRRYPRSGLYPGPVLLGEGHEPLWDRVAHYAQYQRHPADPALPSNGADDDGDRTDHVCGWHHPRDSRGCATLDAAPGRGAGDGCLHRDRHGACHSPVPVHATEDRPHQRGVARADHRGARHPSLRAPGCCRR